MLNAIESELDNDKSSSDSDDDNIYSKKAKRSFPMKPKKSSSKSKTCSHYSTIKKVHTSDLSSKKP